MSLWSFRNLFNPAGMALLGALIWASALSAGTVSLGAAVNYAFFAEPHINTFSFSGANKITGNIVARADGQTTGALNDLSSSTGTAYEDAGSNTPSGDLPVLGNVPAERSLLPVTLIDLTNGFLTLRGGANDIFLVSNSGQFTMNGPSEILLTGGLAANHVLFLVEGAGDLVTIKGNAGSVVNGTILALGSNVDLPTNYSLQGIQGSAGFELNYQPYSAHVPEPSTFILLGFGIGGLLVGRKRQPQRHRD